MSAEKLQGVMQTSAAYKDQIQEVLGLIERLKSTKAPAQILSEANELVQGIEQSTLNGGEASGKTFELLHECRSWLKNRFSAFDPPFFFVLFRVPLQSPSSIAGASGPKAGFGQFDSATITDLLPQQGRYPSIKIDIIGEFILAKFDLGTDASET